jgi:iron complex outermembrane receptor protein
MASYELSDTITAKAIYGYRNSKSVSIFNSDGNVLSPTSGVTFPSTLSQNPTSLDQRAKQHSVELQLLGEALDGRIDWIVGGFWFREEGFDFQNLQLQTDATVRIPFEEGEPSILFYRRGDGVNKSKSVFAHVGFDVTDRLTISGGLRYTKDNKSIIGDTRFPTATGNGCAFNNIPPLSINSGNLCSLTTLTSSDFVSWAADISYKLSDNFFVYAKGANGYRSGGGQARALDNATAAPFKPEKVLEFEVGFKAKLLDRRVSLNVAAFHSKRDDIQSSDTLFASTPFGQRATTFLLNSGTGTIKGIEGELNARLGGGFSIEASASYYDEDRSQALLPSRSPTQLFDVIGQSPFSASASLVYNRDFGFGNVNARVDYTHVPEYWPRQYAVQLLASPFSRVPAYDLVNARAGVTLNDGISLAVFSKNLLGKEYYRGGFAIGTLYPYSYGDPRTYGVEVGFKF